VRPITAWEVIRAVLTVIVFTLLMPVIGTAVAIAGYIGFGFQLASFSTAGLAVLGTLAYGIWFAWPIGFLPSTFAGVLIAIRNLYGAGMRFFEALLLGVLLGAAGVLFLKTGTAENRLLDWLTIAGSVVATIACWWLTRRRTTVPEPTIGP
jgi:hypothetical protein